MKTVNIKGKVIDVTGVYPLKVRDWRELAKHGVTPEDLQGLKNVSAMATLIWYAANKVDQSITKEMLDDLTLDELLRAVNDDGARKVDIDRPSSTLSTASPESTDGPSETSQSVR